MVPGKILFYLAPWGYWGTHCFIYKAALWVLKGNGIKPYQEFPGWRNIGIFEGLAGPDGATMRGNIPVSYMYYNPRSNQGDVLKAVSLYFKKMQQAAINQREYGKNQIFYNSFAKTTAWLGHFLVDALTPPHHKGHYQHAKVSVVLWKFTSNWLDIYAEKVFSRHLKFELRMAFGGRRKYFGNIKIKEELVESIRKSEENLNHYLRDKIKKINLLGIYDEYLEKGYTREISFKVNKILIPEMASVVATVWYAAIKK